MIYLILFIIYLYAMGDLFYMAFTEDRLREKHTCKYYKKCPDNFLCDGLNERKFRCYKREENNNK